MNRRFFPLSFVILCLIVLMACGACVTRKGGSSGALPHPTPGSTPSPDAQASEAEQIWQRFATQAATAEVMTGPFRISANMRYTDPAGESGRVSALLWGNGSADSPYPLRLDLMAGVGSVISKIREDGSSILAYTPSEKTAYVQEGGGRNLSTFGVPIPLTLGDLTLMLSGRSGQLFLPEGAQAIAVPPYHNVTAASVSFTLPSSRLPGILELSSLGAPLSWKELKENGWVIAFESADTAPLLPTKLRITHPKGYSALIVVKDISRVSPPYSSTQMTLVLPPGTKKESLSNESS